MQKLNKNIFHSVFAYLESIRAMDHRCGVMLPIKITAGAWIIGISETRKPCVPDSDWLMDVEWRCSKSNGEMPHFGYFQKPR